MVFFCFKKKHPIIAILGQSPRWRSSTFPSTWCEPLSVSFWYCIVSHVLFQHNFWVVRSNKRIAYNYNDVPIRDVVSTDGADHQVAIRFVVCISRLISNPVHGAFIYTLIGIWSPASRLSSPKVSTSPLGLAKLLDFGILVSSLKLRWWLGFLLCILRKGI